MHASGGWVSQNGWPSRRRRVIPTVKVLIHQKTRLAACCIVPNRPVCYALAVTQSPAPKDSALAAILSFIVPGLGQLYCLRVGSFFAWLLTTILAYVVFVPLGLVVHVFAIVHAFQISRKSMVPGPCPAPPTTKPAHPISQTEPVKDSKLFIAFLVLVGILGAIGIVVLPSIGALEKPNGTPALPLRRFYPWLDRCDIACEQRLGAARIQFIDEQTCETLVPMSGVARAENQAAWDAIIQDKAKSLGCDGF